MSSPPSDASPVNGHASPLADGENNIMDHGDQTDSDLSDVQAAEAEPSSDTPEAEEVTVKNLELQVGEPSDSSEEDASADADFDMDDSPQSPQSDQEDDQPSESSSSRHPQKRKAPTAAEEDFMRDNPELYGLRRSVRAICSRLAPNHSTQAHNPHLVTSWSAKENCKLLHCSWYVCLLTNQLGRFRR